LEFLFPSRAFDHWQSYRRLFVRRLEHDRQRRQRILELGERYSRRASKALAAFAFNQFNFEARQRLWLDRLSALKVVRDRILIGERDARLFDDLAIVRSWHHFLSAAGETLRRLLVSQRDTTIDGLLEIGADAPSDDEAEGRAAHGSIGPASASARRSSLVPETMSPLSRVSVHPDEAVPRS
jgi:hypothetical protein